MFIIQETRRSVIRLYKEDLMETLSVYISLMSKNKYFWIFRRWTFLSCTQRKIIFPDFRVKSPSLHVLNLLTIFRTLFLCCTTVGEENIAHCWTKDLAEKYTLFNTKRSLQTQDDQDTLLMRTTASEFGSFNLVHRFIKITPGYLLNAQTTLRVVIYSRKYIVRDSMAYSEKLNSHLFLLWDAVNTFEPLQSPRTIIDACLSIVQILLCL